MTKNVVYIGIGSNLGNKEKNCSKSVQKIRELPKSTLLKVSQWYLTEPVGVEGQDWYMNGVVSIKTSLGAHDLLDRLLSIEKEMGRIRKEKWESRIIDLDLLLFGEEIIDTATLKIPHPLMHLRRFVLAPMTQLAPALIHPVLRKNMNHLLESLKKEEQKIITKSVFIHD